MLKLLNSNCGLVFADLLNIHIYLFIDIERCISSLSSHGISGLPDHSDNSRHHAGKTDTAALDLNAAHFCTLSSVYQNCLDYPWQIMKETNQNCMKNGH